MMYTKRLGKKGGTTSPFLLLYMYVRPCEGGLGHNRKRFKMAIRGVATLGSSRHVPTHNFHKFYVKYALNEMLIFS